MTNDELKEKLPPYEDDKPVVIMTEDGEYPIGNVVNYPFKVVLEIGPAEVE